ncbi:uncharacterized protein LOC124667410 [Lolium rigidum]|uniref:uncharacterized protein LOC124667410 n=1 Tax=Lolium rigidum TaxID=89674 RepID=UPI001F5C2CA0|nr:uncharacterized protein LOC124667410 [Lolium rigidum]
MDTSRLLQFPATLEKGLEKMIDLKNRLGGVITQVQRWVAKLRPRYQPMWRRVWILDVGHRPRDHLSGAAGAGCPAQVHLPASFVMIPVACGLLHNDEHLLKQEVWHNGGRGRNVRLRACLLASAKPCGCRIPCRCPRSGIVLRDCLVTSTAGPRRLVCIQENGRLSSLLRRFLYISIRFPGLHCLLHAKHYPMSLLKYSNFVFV